MFTHFVSKKINVLLHNPSLSLPFTTSLANLFRISLSQPPSQPPFPTPLTTNSFTTVLHKPLQQQPPSTTSTRQPPSTTSSRQPPSTTSLENLPPPLPFPFWFGFPQCSINRRHCSLPNCPKWFLVCLTMSIYFNGIGENDFLNTCNCSLGMTIFRRLRCNLLKTCPLILFSKKKNLGALQKHSSTRSNKRKILPPRRNSLDSLVV